MINCWTSSPDEWLDIYHRCKSMFSMPFKREEREGEKHDVGRWFNSAKQTFISIHLTEEIFPFQESHQFINFHINKEIFSNHSLAACANDNVIRDKEIQFTFIAFRPATLDQFGDIRFLLFHIIRHIEPLSNFSSSWHKSEAIFLHFMWWMSSTKGTSENEFSSALHQLLLLLLRDGEWACGI